MESKTVKMKKKIKRQPERNQVSGMFHDNRDWYLIGNLSKSWRVEVD